MNTRHEPTNKAMIQVMQSKGTYYFTVFPNDLPLVRGRLQVAARDCDRTVATKYNMRKNELRVVVR